MNIQYSSRSGIVGLDWEVGVWGLSNRLPGISLLHYSLLANYIIYPCFAFPSSVISIWKHIYQLCGDIMLFFSYLVIFSYSGSVGPWRPPGMSLLLPTYRGQDTLLIWSSILKGMACRCLRFIKSWSECTFCRLFSLMIFFY